MSQEPFALSTISPTSIEEEKRDYEAIRATVMQSARGRWFLEEYARRNRTADTQLVLSAIERIERLIRGERNHPGSQDAPAEVSVLPGTAGTAADAVHDPHSGTEGQPPARERSPGALEISALAERLQDVAWTMRERGLDPAICDQIESLASSIIGAPLQRPAEHHAEQLKEPETGRFVPVSDSAETTAGAEQQPLSPSADPASALLAQEGTVSADTVTSSEACVPSESEISAQTGVASETATASECADAIDNLGSDDLARIGALPAVLPFGGEGEPDCQPKPEDVSVAPDAIAKFTAALAQPDHTDRAGAPEHAAAEWPTGEADASVELEDMAPADQAGQSFCAPSPESVTRIDVEWPTTEALNTAETLADPPEHGAVSASFEMASAFPTSDIEWSNADQANFGLAEVDIPPLLVSVAKVPSSAPDRLGQVQLDPLVVERTGAAPPQVASAVMPSEASGDMSQGDNTAENFGPGLEVSPVEQPISSETAAVGTADHQRADPATEAETVAGLTLQPQLIPAPAASEIIPEALPTSAAEEQPSMSVGEQLRGKATCESVLSVAPDQLTQPASQAIAAEIAAAAEFQETAGQNRNHGSIDVQTGPSDNLSGPTAPRATAGDGGDLMEISISLQAPAQERVAEPDTDSPPSQEPLSMSDPLQAMSEAPTSEIEWSSADQANFGLAEVDISPLLVSVAKVPSSAPDRLGQLQLDPLVVERTDAAPPQVASAVMPSEASGDMSQGDNTAENFGPGLEVSPVEQPISSETAAVGTADHQRADPATEAETVAGLTLQPQLIPAPAASEIIPEALPTSAAEEQPSMPVGEQLPGKATCESVLSVAPDQLTPPASQAIAAEIAAAAEFQETAGQNRNHGSIDVQTGPSDNLSGPTAPRATAGDAGDLMEISISLQAPAQERVAEPDTDSPPSQEPLSMSDPLQAISEATSPAPTETPIEVSAQTPSHALTQRQCEAAPRSRDSAAAEALRLAPAGDSPEAPIAPLRSVADTNEPLPLSFEESVFADEPTAAIASGESVPAMPLLLSDISHEDILSGAWEEAASGSQMEAPGAAQPDAPRLKRPLDALDPSKHDIWAEPAAAAGAPIPQEPDAILHLEEELFATPLAAHKEVTPPARAPGEGTPASPSQIDQTEVPTVGATMALQLEAVVQAPALIEPAAAPAAPVRPVARAMPRAAPSDPLAALKAMTEEERIAVFT